MNNVIDQYMNFLLNAFKYDMEVFSKPWIYICLLIPAILYFCFFVIKWYIMLFPVWFTARLILSPFYPKRKNKKKKLDKES